MVLQFTSQDYLNLIFENRKLTFSHNKWQCVSTNTNKRVKVRFCPKLRYIWTSKDFMVYKFQSLSWVIWNNVRDPSILWSIYILIFTKSNEIFISRLNIHKTILWQFLEFFEKFEILLSLFYIKVASRSLNYS